MPVWHSFAGWKEKLTCPEELALHINQAPFKPYRFPVWLGNREKKQSRYHGIQSWASPLSWFKPGHSYIVTWLISNSTFLHHPAVQTSTSQKKVIILLQPCSTGLFQKLDIVLSRDCHAITSVHLELSPIIWGWFFTPQVEHKATHCQLCPPFQRRNSKMR